jgi:hypothetical protein
MDKNIQLQALITEREGYLAENTHRIACGNSIAYGAEAFNELAEQIRALDTAELAATDSQQLQAAIALVREAANNDDISAVAFARFNNVLLTIEQRAAV